MPNDTFREFIWGKLEITLAVAVKDPPSWAVLEMPAARGDGLPFV